MNIQSTKSSEEITFKHLAKSDLPLLTTWLNKPHVKAWWDEHLTPDEIKEQYASRIGDQIVVPFMVYLDEKPIGFIQYYDAAKEGGGWWPDEVEGTIGIDQFIGEENYMGRGYGTKIIAAFVRKLFEDPAVKKIILDVSPKNVKAIHCYEKVGFVFVKEIDTPDGHALMMEIKRNTEV